MWMMLVFTANSLLNFVVSLLVAKFLGPAEYGRFTVALAASVILELLCFDWLRLAATRFYSQRDQAEKPQVRATLDRAFVWIGLGASAVSIGAFFIGPDLSLSPDLVSLAIGVAITNGMFDFSCALLRSRFLDRPYGILVIVKNILAFLLTVGGAFALGSARVALLGLMVSAAGSLVAAREGLIDPNARKAAPDRALALRFLGYGLPIIAANILYQSTPLLNRVVVSQTLGFAEAGQLSLAFEIGVRIVGAIGSALDVILFQIAVRAEKTIGVEGARAQVSRNMGVVFAIVVPAVLGCWLILPSFESLFVPQNYRGPFAHYFTLMAPALAAFALINYALNPAYQISHRLAPLIIGALFAVLVNLLAIELLPSGADATKFAVAQSLSSLAGMIALFLMLFLLEPMWPRARDILGATFASALMLAAALPLRALTPGPLAMAAQIAVGAGVYVAAAAALDIAGLRTLLFYRPRVSAQADC